MIRLAGMVLLIGVACFAAGITRPVVVDYFSTDSGVAKRQLVEENPGQWEFANAMIDLGIVIPAIGVILFTFALRLRSKDNKLFLLAVASAASVSLAVDVWHNYWAFPRFTVLMAFSIVLLGFIIGHQFSKWGGGFTIAVELVEVILLYITLRDVPPGAHLPALLIAGITLLFWGGTENLHNSVHVTLDHQS